MTGNRQAGRWLRAYLRDTWVLIRQFRYTLLVFAAFLLIGTLILRWTYSHDPAWGWSNAFYAALALMFFETPEAYPTHFLAQLVFILWPILGVMIVVNGVVQFGTALFNRQERKEAWQVAVASTFRHHIIVCGLGKVGYRVVLQLLKMKQEVVGIELNPQAPFLEQIRAEGVPVLIGDARNQEMLKKAGIERAQAVVACTEYDLTNLEIALDAREMAPDVKVVMRMFDQQLAERVRKGFGIRTAFSTSALSAPAFAAAATRAAVEYSLYVDDVLLNVHRTTVSGLAGKTVSQVEQEIDLSIVLHDRAGKMDLHPPGELVLQAGDRIVVFATLESLACLEQMNERREPCPPSQRGPRTWLSRLKRGSSQRAAP